MTTSFSVGEQEYEAKNFKDRQLDSSGDDSELSETFTNDIGNMDECPKFLGCSGNKL